MNNHLNNFFDTSQVMYVEFDIHKKMFTHVNKSFIDKIGYSEKELLSNPISKFILDEDIKLSYNFIKNLNGNPGTRVVNRYKHKNTGEIITLMWFNGGVTEAMENKKGILSTFAIDISNVIKDINEQKLENSLLIEFIEILRM